MIDDATPASDPAIDTLVRLPFEVDARLTLSAWQHGPGDPTIRFEGPVAWLALRLAEGPASLRLAPAGGGWRVTAWGPGAEPALASVPRLLGSEDDPAALRLPPGHLRELARRFRGLRFGRSDAVLAALLPAIVGQKVTAEEAQRSYRRLVLRFGEAAPGPGRLHLPPAAATLAASPYHVLHPLGLEERRAMTIIRAARLADRLEEAIRLPRAEAMARLRVVPGVGPWTAAETARRAFGDADAISLGDANLPNLVCWLLAGEARGDDARMLELLEPYDGQRARVARLLVLSGGAAPRFGPRHRLRSIEHI